jgi:hypothetical protein
MGPSWTLLAMAFICVAFAASDAAPAVVLEGVFPQPSFFVSIKGASAQVDQLTFFCGGVLLSPRLVLTLFLCLTDDDSRTLLSRGVRAQTGIFLDDSFKREVLGVSLVSSGVFVSRYWKLRNSSDFYFSDVAIVESVEPFHVSHRVVPAVLPHSDAILQPSLLRFGFPGGPYSWHDFLPLKWVNSSLTECEVPADGFCVTGLAMGLGDVACVTTPCADDSNASCLTPVGLLVQLSREQKLVHVSLVDPVRSSWIRAVMDGAVEPDGALTVPGCSSRALVSLVALCVVAFF